MVQTVFYFSGYETGDASEINSIGAGASVQSGTVRTGTYALKQAATSSRVVAAMGSTQASVRFYINPTGTGTAVNIFRENTTIRLNLARGTTDLLTISDNGVTLGLTATPGTNAVTAGVWTLIEVAWDLAAGGVVKVWVNGTLDIDVTHTNDVSATTTQNINVIGRANPNEYFFDDIRADIGGVARIGAGQCRMVQGTAGTPTYDTWTKTGAATAALCWSETPFNAAIACHDTTAGDVQTMFIAAAPVAAADTINAVKIAMVGKTSSTTTDGIDSIRRRVGGADTDVSASPKWTAVDSYREVYVTGLTYANLTDGTTEIGVVKGTGTNDHRVEDMWLMVDYTPAATGIAVQGFQMAGGGMLVGGAMIG